MSANVVRTFWTVDPFKCVLVGRPNRYVLQIFIGSAAFLTESVRTVARDGPAPNCYSSFSERRVVEQARRVTPQSQQLKRVRFFFQERI
jgi:hypothetical protein